VFYAGRRFDLELVDPAEQFDHEEDRGGGLSAPMSGKVLSVLVAAGTQVEKGAPLLVMEAMKMEHTIFAPAKGRVAQIRYAAGEQVAEGAELVAFEAAAVEPA
jgi:3-methylcrotonyl-CoA carboxylase alpha subunit